MLKNIVRSISISILLIVTVQVYCVQKTEATATSASSAIKKFSGGLILESPSTQVTEAQTSCESGEICEGETNVWADLASTTCEKGTFTLKTYSPKKASTDYCVPISAKGTRKISSGKLILTAYTQPVATDIGTCTCTEGTTSTTVTVSADLAQVVLYGTN